MPILIGVNLDGTLAEVDDAKPFDGTIGKPVYRMVEWVNYQLAIGNQVEIFTARVSEDPTCVTQIQDWLEQVAQLPRLPVGCIKKKAFSLFVDDKALQVLKNEGIVVEYGKYPLQNRTPPNRGRLLNRRR